MRLRPRWCVLALIMTSGCASHRIGMSGTPPFLQVRPRYPSEPVGTFWRESFDTLSAERWRNVVVHGQTAYEAATLDGRACVKATSHAAASILLTPVTFDPDQQASLSWDWRVEQPVAHEALERKNGSDAAARVYVYFDTRGLPWQKRGIDYVWSAHLPVGTVLDSAFSSNSKILVVESGAEHVGQWRHVERNLVEDYARCFGKRAPPNVVAIGLMTDTDNTGGDAVAYFDEVTIGRAPAGASEIGRAHV